MCFSGHRYEVPEARRERRPAERVDPGVRVSDADRQRVIDQLRVHTTDGRLTLDEFEARVGEAWTATTHGELRSVLRELPALPRVGTTRSRRRVGPPVPVLIVALVVIGSLLMDHFAWWLIPVGFWMFGGCGAPRHQRAVSRDEVLSSA